MIKSIFSSPRGGWLTHSLTHTHRYKC